MTGGPAHQGSSGHRAPSFFCEARRQEDVFTQRRKDGKKPVRNAAALCVFAPLLENNLNLTLALRLRQEHGDFLFRDILHVHEDAEDAPQLRLFSSGGVEPGGQ